MSLKTHADWGRLKEALTRCERYAQGFAAVVFRSTSVDYANRDDLLTGQGARREGGRWNPPESVATVYASLEYMTAIEEGLSHFRYYNLPVEEALPRVLVSLRVKLERVLDLTNSPVRKTLGVTFAQMTQGDWRALNRKGRMALTQAIGRLAWDKSWEGLIVPSSETSKGKNLVLFPGNRPPPGIEVINPGKLPPHP